MALLNTQHSQFVWKFEPWFFPDAIENKYASFFSKAKSAYKSVKDMTNTHILGCSFPSLSIENATQQRKRHTIEYKEVKFTDNLFDRKFTVTFESVYGHINYFMMLDLLIYNYEDVYSESRTHYPGFLWHILGHNGDLLYTIRFDRVVPNSLSNVDFSYSENDIVSQVTFSVDFTFNFITMDYALDLGDKYNFLGGNIANTAGR